MQRAAYLCYVPAHYQFFRRVHERLAREVEIVVPLSPNGVEDAQRTSEWLRAEGVEHCVRSRGRYSFLLSCILTTRRDRARFGRWDTRHVRMLYATNSKRYNFSRKNRAFDLIHTIGPDSEERLTPFARCVSVGLPRFDDLFAGRIRREEVLADLEVTDERPVLLHAPTWGEISSLDRFGAEISKLSDEFTVIVKPHPLTPQKEPERLRIFESAPVLLLTGEYPLDRLLAASDLLISDYSSSIFEAAACDRPVLLLDCPADDLERSQLFDPADPEHTARDIGPRVDDPAELRPAVNGALADPGVFAERRRYHTQRIFVSTDGQAAKRCEASLREFFASPRGARLRARQIRRLPSFLYTRVRDLLLQPRPAPFSPAS